MSPASKKFNYFSKKAHAGGDKLKIFYLSVAFSILLTFLSLPFDVFLQYGDMKLGHKSDRNLIALKDYFIIDSVSFEKKKERVRKSLPVVLDADSRVMDDGLDKLEKAFAKMRKWAQTRPYEKHFSENEILDEGKDLFQKSFSIKDFSRDGFSELWALKFSEKLEEQVELVIADLMQKGLMDGTDQIDADRKILKRTLPDYEETTMEERNFIYGRGELKKFVEDRVEKSGSVFLKKHSGVFAEFIAGYASPNIFLNLPETERREKEALKKIAPAYFVIKKGETIISKGDVLLPGVYEKIKAVKNAESEKISAFNIAVNFLVYLFFTVLFHVVSSSSVKKFMDDFKSTAFTFTIVLLTVSFAVLFYLIGIQLSFNYNLFPFVLVLFVPYAFTGMLLRLFLNSETAIISLFFLVVITGNIFAGNFYFLLFLLGSSLVGMHLIGHYYTRGEILKSGIKIGIFNLLILTVMYGLMDSETVHAADKYIVLAGAMAGGLASSMLLIVLTPMLEYAFGYTTNIKLLELGNLDHPLLKELMVKAPGTYNHSIQIGNLVEAAAQAIKVNPLLARVSAYYHDIGKIKMPEFFIENQVTAYNKHDELSPHMSVLIVSSHVKEGIELAGRYNLGEPIIDAISQHHGTRLVTYFYAKALKQDVNVKEEDFRYHGTKPRTREIGLIMMADAVEAACRVLDDPSPSRINTLAKKIIQDIFLDGQLDECELTLKDLNLVVDSFSRTLLGIYHQRVDYPEIKSLKENGNGNGKKPVQ